MCTPPANPAANSGTFASPDSKGLPPIGKVGWSESPTDPLFRFSIVVIFVGGSARFLVLSCNCTSMAISNLLDAQSVSLNEIIGNGKVYFVPLFQREYSWEVEHWEELWTDLVRTLETGEPHFMGSVVIQQKGEPDAKTFWIIDGQQRLTTLSILALVVINQLHRWAEGGIESEGNLERAELLRGQYIGQKDPVSLLYSSKLILNEQSDAFYRFRLINYRPPVAVPKLTDAEKRLWEAYLFFQARVESIFSSSRSGELITTFLTRTVGERLQFIQIKVLNDLNAYTVFETLNARGVALTTTDLLKNYLFSMVAKSSSDLLAVKEQWNKVIRMVGMERFPTFLRHYLNGMIPLVSRSTLFKSVKKRVQSDEQVLELLDQLERAAYYYLAIQDAEDELWRTDKELREQINTLNLFQLEQQGVLSFLMVALQRLDRSAVKRLVSALVVLGFRRTVIAQLPSQPMEVFLNKLSIQLQEETNFTDVRPLLSALKEVCPDNDTFRSHFERRVFDTNQPLQKKWVRYILYKLEAQLPGGLKLDPTLDDGTIEHILPEHLNEHWSVLWSDQEHARGVYLLGNLTLLSPSANHKQVGQTSFEEKRAVYANSRYALSRQIQEGQEWTLSRIQHRQAGLAKTATGIWQLPF